MEITYKGYSIITKKDEKRYCATGINGVYKENSMGESEEDAGRKKMLLSIKTSHFGEKFFPT